MEAAIEAGSSDGQSPAAVDRPKGPLWSLPDGFQEDGISKDIEVPDADAELLLGASELLAPLKKLRRISSPELSICNCKITDQFLFVLCTSHDGSGNGNGSR